ncbi:hypothetical protein ACFC1B_07065 [Streptomyces xiamenensis]|uniref:hypothetical protein n=1 Tax=Streptomyces xiamenensis TaxID=408015 RepID=UPI0035D75A61
MTRYRASAPHRSVSDYSRTIHGQPLVRCTDCCWAQLLNERLHEGPWGLIYWHADHPDDAVDHLAPMPERLAIPAYIEWWQSGGWLAIEDTRSEGPGTLMGDEFLEIFRSVRAANSLEEAVLANTQRRRIFPSTARADIEEAAAGLFHAGLLRPADRQEWHTR